MRHSHVGFLGSAAIPFLVLGAAFAAPPQDPPGARVLQAPIISPKAFSFGQYVTYTNPDAFLRNPNLPDKAMEIPNGRQTQASRRELLARAIADTGFTLDIDAGSQKILEKSSNIYFGADRLTAADIIHSMVRTPSGPNALDYSVNGKTIKVFPAAKDATGFTLRRVSVDASDASLKDVLTDLLGHTGYHLFLPMRFDTKITVQCRDVTVGEAIRAVLAAAPGSLQAVPMGSGSSGPTLFIGEGRPQLK
ncbi:MAG: hypothetical protein V4671_14050 [Armatimonadota bacterium]